MLLWLMNLGFAGGTATVRNQSYVGIESHVNITKGLRSFVDLVKGVESHVTLTKGLKSHVDSVHGLDSEIH